MPVRGVISRNSSFSNIILYIYSFIFYILSEYCTAFWIVHIESMSDECSDHERLVRLIRQIAREEAWEVIDEHLDDYEYKEKPAEDFEVESGEEKRNYGE